MKYIDRQGVITEYDSGQDKLLKFLYTSKFGRFVLGFLIHPGISKLGGWFLDTGFSRLFIAPFVKKNHIDLSGCDKTSFDSYNDFFTRRLRPDCRPIPEDPALLISPCDGKLSLYQIDGHSRFSIKNTEYTLTSLLHSSKAARYYNGGYACIFRLTVDDYHRYCYPCSGRKSANYRIPGVFHTVNPAANDVFPIYKENTREFCLLKTEYAQTLLMMEVGALMVGKIHNYQEAAYVTRGTEKGRFEFGGSTIVLLIPAGQFKPDGQLLENTRNGYETIMKSGEPIGRFQE